MRNSNRTPFTLTVGYQANQCQPCYIHTFPRIFPAVALTDKWALTNSFHYCPPPVCYCQTQSLFFDGMNLFIKKTSHETLIPLHRTNWLSVTGVNFHELSTESPEMLRNTWPSESDSRRWLSEIPSKSHVDELKITKLPAVKVSMQFSRRRLSLDDELHFCGENCSTISSITISLANKILTVAHRLPYCVWW